MINYIKASYKKCTQIKGQTGCMYDIYIHDGDGVRYVLGKSGDRPLIAFGINPSTATGEKSDHTISRIKSYMFKYGFDGFKMLNIYPARAKDPDDLPEVIDSDTIVPTLKPSNRQLTTEAESYVHGANWY